MKFYCVSFICFFLVLFFACDKNELSNDPSLQLKISTDSILFDTVFTTIGSTIEAFKIFNENNRDIEISSLQIVGGDQSNFRINYDGVNGVIFNNQVVPANDSVYVFVEVTVDESNEQLPFVMTDSVLLDYNGNEKKVVLEAWGQNANFHRNDTITGQETWTNDLPHVIYGPLLVDEGANLTIDKGTKVYGHPNGGIFVKGSLNVNGEWDEVVEFNGDRLESFFLNQPAQWNGIFVLRNETQGGIAQINHAIIDNTLYGISAGSSDCSIESEQDFLDCFTVENAPLVEVNNTIIKNAFVSGLYGFVAEIKANNVLVHSCGKNNFETLLQGDYEMKHCTFANYGSPTTSHKDAIISIADFAILEFADNPGVGALFTGGTQMNISMENCIVMGSLGEELFLNADNNSIYDNVNFDYCLLKTERDITESRFSNCLFNPSFSDSTFVDQWGLDYHLSKLSLARDNGNVLGILTDLENIQRDASPDLGCYEFIE